MSETIINPDKKYPPIKIRMYDAYVAVVKIVYPNFNESVKNTTK